MTEAADRAVRVEPFRHTVQRCPPPYGTRLGVMVPGDSRANHLHDEDLAREMERLADGAVGMHEGIAQLPPQRVAAQVHERKPTPQRISHGMQVWK